MPNLRLILILALATAAPARAAPAPLSDPQVRGFVQRQTKTWNAGDLDAYFATFTPDARFTDQALGNDNKIVPYGASTVAQARAQARRSLAKGRSIETSVIRQDYIFPGGRRARVVSEVAIHIAGGARDRVVCAHRVAIVEQTPAGLRASGQTDTIVRCRAGGVR